MDVCTPPPEDSLFMKTRCSTRTITRLVSSKARTSLSTFERVIATHPPIVESLLLQLPTSAILDLYHTSRYLRSFLESYPTAWNYLSFRLFSHGRAEMRQSSPASDTSGESPFRRSKKSALDQLLVTVILPIGTRLKTLDLDHTAAGGLALTAKILPAQRETLQHLSVRGCKQVSLKYHIVPYLTLFSLQKSVSSLNKSVHVDHLALKSLYTFRCRHHRRRPYLPASLLRTDSDAEPTHELIKICYNLGIWTDTAWCPTPGGRCLRRKDYYTGRGNLDGRGEVWVVFDRLWRSGNTLGSHDAELAKSGAYRGQLWAESEYGYEGEPLGCEGQPGQGEGRMVPTHLRRSHGMFIENFRCHDCGERILERCEQCSVRMHCMGCRKTLCASCAFARPLPRSRKSKVDDSATAKADDRARQDPFWWAPGEMRSPNLMMQESSGDDGHIGTDPSSSSTPNLKMHWCCLRPMFSGGGGISFVGPDMNGAGAGQIRTAPLPRSKGYEDPEFARIRHDEDFPVAAYGKPDSPDYTLQEGHDQMLHWLLYGPGSQDNSMCPRSLCQECWQAPGWRAACQACREPFCFAHDLRGLKMRICGYRDLTVEKRHMDERPIKTSQMPSKKSEDELLEAIRNLLLLTENPQHTQELAALTTLPESNDTDLTTDTEDHNLPLKSSPTFSINNADVGPSSANATPPTTPRPPITPVPSPPPLWRGCASFLCPEYRPIGDHRPKCTAAARECTLCGVHVCPDCLLKDPPCDCSHCQKNYRCPRCFKWLGQTLCQKAEELEIERCNREAEREMEKRKREERDSADVVAELAGSFMDISTSWSG